jgi:two-component system, chemotaxis family, CheB/CheR fusion protein
MTEPDKDLQDLLEFIRDLRGFDFSTYKPSTLGRRIRKRMQDVDKTSFADYRDLLETDPDEFTQLFNTVLINVTSFFRDPEAWDYLRTVIVPSVVQSAEDNEVRLWSAGCSSGEEAYSLAMTFAEEMGVEAFNERVKIYATDIDEEALATARRGVFSPKSMDAVPEELQEKYFERGGTGSAFRPDVRRKVIFGRLDLISDAPISRLHLVSCRNTLMYFNAEAQDQLMRRLHFALRDGGVLFLGKAEMLMTDGSRFVPLNMPYRIFRCRPGSHGATGPLAPLDVSRALSSEAFRSRQLRDLALDADPIPRLVIDASGTTVLINAQAKTMFGLTDRDEGRPLRDLEVSYRPAELRSLIEQAQSERRNVRKNAVERSIGPQDLQYLDILVNPIVSPDGQAIGATVTFQDATGYVRLQQEVKTSREELETAYEELQSTNEELETTNEELQSTNEELETTNEELQSTNEELETTNEELQSTNEELETMNEELRIRSSELDQANTYLSGVLSNVPVAVVVLDADLRVRTWNLVCEDLWGLRGDEVLGESFFGLDLGLPTGPLRQPVRACLDGSVHERLELEAVNRRGQPITCVVTCSPLSETASGVILLLEARSR